jgi:hypothetical protein
MSDREPVCITCGHSTATDTIGNKMADGTPCSSCFERVLDAQPPLLPNFSFDFEWVPEVEFGEEMSILVEFEEDDDGPMGA